MNAKALRAEIEATLLRNLQIALYEHPATRGDDHAGCLRIEIVHLIMLACAANLAQILAERTADPGEAITDTITTDQHHSVDPIAQKASEQ